MWINKVIFGRVSHRFAVMASRRVGGRFGPLKRRIELLWRRSNWGSWIPTHFAFENADPSTALRTEWMGHPVSPFAEEPQGLRFRCASLRMTDLLFVCGGGQIGFNLALGQMIEPGEFENQRSNQDDGYGKRNAVPLLNDDV